MGFRTTLAVAALVTIAIELPALAQKNYGPGVSDTEVKIGSTGPVSNAASSASAEMRSFAAYFAEINAEEGGVNGRKINVVAADDGGEPTRAIEQTRKLVEQDGVLFMANSLGTPAQLAVRQYLNDRKVPQLFPASGAAPFYDARNSPWTVGFAPSNDREGRLIGKYVGESMPGAKIGVLYQNDDVGKDFLRGAKESSGASIVAQQSYDVGDAKIDAQIASLQASGADVLFAFATEQTAALAIRRAAAIGWKPKIFIPSSVPSAAVLEAAGLDNARGVVKAAYLKDPASPGWENDPDAKEFAAWMKKYDSSVNIHDTVAAMHGYVVARLIEKILKAAGNDLSRENILKQANDLHHVVLPLLLPGITVDTSPTDHRAIDQLRFEYFDGENWVLTGNTVSE